MDTMPALPLPGMAAGTAAAASEAVSSFEDSGLPPFPDPKSIVMMITSMMGRTATCVNHTSNWRDNQVLVCVSRPDDGAVGVVNEARMVMAPLFFLATHRPCDSDEKPKTRRLTHKLTN